MHRLQTNAGGFFNGFCKFVSFFGKGGWFFILSAFVFLFFKARRKEGLGMAFALIIGALLTNILLKNIVARARPFNRENAPFYEWWLAAGANPEDSYSFPSGHTTAAFAAMVAFFLLGDKRYSFTGLLFAVLMGFSRIYLIVHYPTDVLAGFVIGTVAGIAGYFLSKLCYRKIGGKCGELLREWSIVTQCRAWAHKNNGTSTARPEPQESDPATDAQTRENDPPPDRQ